MAHKEDTIALVPKMEKASAWLLEDPSRKMKEACSRFGVPYGTFWLLHERNLVRQAKGKIYTDAELIKAGDAGVGAIITSLRDQKRKSWGHIAAVLGDAPLGTPEARVRTLYAKYSGKHHEGQRIGHGGRWLGGVEFHEVLYRGENLDGQDAKAAGTTDEVGADLLNDTVAKVLAKREAEAKAAREAAKANAPAKPKRQPKKVAAKSAAA